MIVLKTLGLFGVFIGCAGVGFATSGRLLNRRRLLNLCLKLCEAVTAEIRYSGAPIAMVMSRVSRQSGIVPLCIPNGWNKEKWNRWIGERKEEWSSADESVFREWIEGLGVSDRDGQIEHGRLYAARFRSLCEDAERDVKQKARVYLLLGSMTGLAAVLLLM